jgi:hypothetical protein
MTGAQPSQGELQPAGVPLDQALGRQLQQQAWAARNLGAGAAGSSSGQKEGWAIRSLLIACSAMPGGAAEPKP